MEEKPNLDVVDEKVVWSLVFAALALLALVGSMVRAYGQGDLLRYLAACVIMFATYLGLKAFWRKRCRKAVCADFLLAEVAPLMLRLYALIFVLALLVLVGAELFPIFPVMYFCF